MSDRIIDLRSDTVTKPTVAMRQAMAEAEVGDDVLGDDMTVAALERRTAEFLDKEAAVFVPSGTMANQVAIRCHTSPGDEMLLDANAHMYWYEVGGSAALSGVICRTLPGIRGVFSADDVLSALRPVNVHFPPTRLLAVENTHNRGGGAIWPLEQIREVCETAHQRDVRTHLDGARLWNASVATGIPEAEYAADFDSVSVCFSKGLGAPVGSALAGSGEVVANARRFRKQFGGGMRQAGIIAAGALYALDHHRDRLAEDHANAKLLARGLADLRPIRVDPDLVDTNMVYFDIESITAARLTELLKELKVLVLATGEHTIRAIPNLTIENDDIGRTVEAVRKVISKQ